MTYLKQSAAMLTGIALLFTTYTAMAGSDNAESSTTIPLDTPQAFGVDYENVSYKGHMATHINVSAEHKSIEEGGCDNCTFLLVDDTPFKNGTIEVDLAGKPSEGAPDWARGFVGVVFRVKNNQQEQYEGFYLRPMNALEEGPRRNHTAQYFAYPDHPWHVLRENHPDKYERYANVQPGEWHTLRIEVEGEKAQFFIDDQEVLTVNPLLNGADLSGGIGFFTEPATEAYFKNLRITHK